MLWWQILITKAARDHRHEAGVLVLTAALKQLVWPYSPGLPCNLVAKCHIT